MCIALGLSAIALSVIWYQTRDVFTGAQGPFPAAFAAGAPVAPERVVRRPPDEQILVHGLSLQWTSPGVTAVNLRTGKGTGQEPVRGAPPYARTGAPADPEGVGRAPARAGRGGDPVHPGAAAV